MNKEKLMSAINGIDDRYIIKFAEVKPEIKTKAMWLKIAAVAACLCFAVTGTALFMKNIEPRGSRPSAYIPEGSETNASQSSSKPNTDVSQSVETSAPQPGETIWAGDGDQIWKDYSEQAVKGSIILADELKAVMEKSDNTADVFAVRVTDTAGASKEEIYNAFVKPLGIAEEFMESDVIFVTAEQINALVCPPELALVLYLKIKPYKDIWIDQEYLETAGTEKIQVNVLLKFNDGAVLAKYKEELDALEGNDEERLILQRSIIKKEVAQIIDTFLNDYGISYEEVKTGIYTSQFTAELEPELIVRLLMDDRIEGILKTTDTLDFDQ
ncbi:MAG: hypothetical protein NC223_01875 [Butyrivibrio sp.]|nr:hypothetical protein [Butyrivibrio sp.]